MKKTFQNLKTWFLALFSTSGTITSILLGLAIMAMLGVLSVQGQPDDGTMGWGGYLVACLVSLFALVSVYFVIRNFREEVYRNYVNTRSLNLDNLINRLRYTFIHALKPTLKKYPSLYIFTICTFLSVVFFIFNREISAICFILIAHIFLINSLKNGSN